MAAFTSSGRSCCVQCPQPGSITASRRSGTQCRRSCSVFSRHIQRRYAHFGASPGREQFPIAIDVSVPVQASAITGVAELIGVEIDVGLEQPWWQGLGRIERIQEPAAARHHAGRPLAGARWAARWIAGAPVEELANRAARVLFEFRFRVTGLLKVELIEVRIGCLRHQARGSVGAAWPKGHAQADDRPESVRAQQRRMPGHRRPPVVPCNERGRLA